MSRSQRVFRYLFYGVWSVVMTALTYVLGAVSLKVLRLKAGRISYWALTLALSAALFAAGVPILAIAFFSVVLLVGTFSELEEMGFRMEASAFFTLVINSLLGSGLFAFWVYSTGARWQQQLVGTVENLLKPLASLNPALQINYQDIALQLPSIVLILWMGALYLAILLEGRLAGSDSLTPVGYPSMRTQLSEFRLPDPAIWLFTLALLGAFGNLPWKPVEVVAVNVLNICFLLFFFQGIAVVAKFFETIRMGYFWQFLFMVLIVVHLFLFVSLLGLVDYWFDFRSRLTKRAQEVNRET